MDVFLGKITQQAMNYAIRSGVTITASYAIKQSARLLKAVEGNEREELQELQERLDNKIKIISPAIDMIELISARGNTSLESAVTLTKSLRWEIQSLGQRLATAANKEEQIQRRNAKAQGKTQHTQELKQIVQAIRKILIQIEDSVPLINLAITASGANLASSLPTTVSPSRLLQASTFLTAGDSQYGMLGSKAVQIGPVFTLSMYMLFQGHLKPQNEEDVREATWKEAIHKADVRLMRVPIDALYDLPSAHSDPLQNHSLSPDSKYVDTDSSSHEIDCMVRADEFAYQLLIVEDFADDRVHDFAGEESQPKPYGDIALAGIQEVIPIHELSKIFYADTGKILSIGNEGENNNPVLLLKRDVNAPPPRRMVDRYVEEDADRVYGGNTISDDGQAVVFSQEKVLSPKIHQNPQPKRISNPWRLPQDLDPEWIAFEVYTEADDSDTEAEASTDSPRPSPSSRSTSVDPSMISKMSHLSINGINAATSSPKPMFVHHLQNQQPSLPPIRTSLSLLEMLLRLLSLQQFQQAPHLSIPDELLTFFLSESASTGAASSDVQERKRLREEARRRVGFDPYDESPVKRRGEDYQHRGGQPDEWHSERYSNSENGYLSPLRYEDEGYGTRDWMQSPHGQRTSISRGGTPQTPLLLKNRSASGTPLSPSSRSDEQPQPLSRWSGSLRSRTAESGKKGSPLARPGTGITDEALGTSPASVGKRENAE